MAEKYQIAFTGDATKPELLKAIAALAEILTNTSDEDLADWNNDDTPVLYLADIAQGVITPYP